MWNWINFAPTVYWKKNHWYFVDTFFLRCTLHRINQTVPLCSKWHMQRVTYWKVTRTELCSCLFRVRSKVLRKRNQGKMANGKLVCIRTKWFYIFSAAWIEYNSMSVFFIKCSYEFFKINLIVNKCIKRQEKLCNNKQKIRNKIAKIYFICIWKCRRCELAPTSIVWLC